MKTLKTVILSLPISLFLLSAFSLPALAAVDPGGGAPTTKPKSNTPVDVNPDCNNPSAKGLQTCLKQNKIITDLNKIINFLSAGVAIVVIGAIILGGIQYSMAGGNPDAVNKAKQRITNALLAFAIFIFIFAFLQWIIPGGL